MREQLHLIFAKPDGKKLTIRVDDPTDSLSKNNIQSAALDIVESGIFGEIVPLSAQIITTQIEIVELAD